jgi:hypothetical protein
MSEIPSGGLTSAFLAWFRNATEASWARTDTPTLADFERTRTTGAVFQRGTRWSGGFTASEIARAEEKHRVLFPPDLRLFLETLGTTDRPRIGAGFDKRNRVVIVETSGFADWRRGDEIRRARAWVVDGLLFDVEENALWLEAWPARPTDAEARSAIVRAAVTAAPPLLPLLGHRFLVGEPFRVGNPVLSVMQSDIIVYGGDLRDYLLTEFASCLCESPRHVDGDAHEKASATPFWNEFIS